MKSLECCRSYKMAAATGHDVHIQGRKRSEETVLATFVLSSRGKGANLSQKHSRISLKIKPPRPELYNFVSDSCKIR